MVEPREYSRAEAWLDLIQAAGIEERVIILDGRAIESRRGELAASRRFLENRWRWSAGKVTRFLDMLKSQGMIETRKEHGQTVIRLCNYDTYNPWLQTVIPAEKPATNREPNRIIML